MKQSVIGLEMYLFLCCGVTVSLQATIMTCKIRMSPISFLIPPQFPGRSRNEFVFRGIGLEVACN